MSWETTASGNHFSSLFCFSTSSRSSSYSLSLHDALPISFNLREGFALGDAVNQIKELAINTLPDTIATQDRKSTRLNSSHVAISYAVFCLKKKSAISASMAWTEASSRVGSGNSHRR